MVFAKALQASGESVIVDAKGGKHNWREELARKLLSLQHPEGYWVNTDKAEMQDNKVAGHRVHHDGRASDPAVGIVRQSGPAVPPSPTMRVITVAGVLAAGLMHERRSSRHPAPWGCVSRRAWEGWPAGRGPRSG
jgi:hypothetical protein